MISAIMSARQKKGKMAEPLDPAVLGVASVLKSLRTRAGLREERLQATELALDTLVGLESIRALVSAGDSPEGAIVRAVRAAAGTLDPKTSIIVDASLGLGLCADPVPDPELYAQDLGQRREALLRNWKRLHELRSVPADKPPSLGKLRLKVESEALTALAVALTSSASTRVPAIAPTVVNELQVGEPKPEDTTAIAAAPTLLQTFREVAKVLRTALYRDADRMLTGWQQDLSQPPTRVTAVSTAYGIRTMLLLEGRLAEDLHPVMESLKRSAFPEDSHPVMESHKQMAYSEGEYASTGQGRPSAEATATVLNALCRIAAIDDTKSHLARLEGGLGDFEKFRPFILTTMLETSMLLGPQAPLIDVLVESLLAARLSYPEGQLWPENSDPQLTKPDASVAHTARAVRVLANLQSLRPSGLVQEALDQAVPWLIGQQKLHNTDEHIERPTDLKSVRTYHFTAAWVVKALVSAGLPAGHPAVRNAITQMGRNYVSNRALWKSDRGDVPIWMTFDAIEALRLAYPAVRYGIM
jgi:hypothetical protein